MIKDKVSIKISASNYKHFFLLGYKDISAGDTILVEFEELKPNSEVNLIWFCDECGEKQHTTMRPSRYTGRCRACANKVQALGYKYTEEQSKSRSKQQSGENNHRWNDNLTDADRVHRRDRRHDAWAKAVKEVGDYKCDLCCSCDNLVAHHLNAYAKFEEVRYSIDNGVCLCRSCHSTFHGKYGTGTNTKEQYEEFKELNND